MPYDAQLNIQNFRSIKSLQISGLGQFNLFIGKNNCGKSTVLEAVYMASAVPQLPLFAMNTGRGANPVQNEDFVTLFHDFNIEKPVSVRFSDDAYFREVSVSAVKLNRMPQVVMNCMPQEQSLIGHYGIEVKSDSLKTPYSVRYNQKDVTPERIILSDEEIQNLNDDKSVRSVQFITAQWLNYNTVEYVNNLVVNKQKDSLITSLKKIDGRIKDIQIGNNNTIYIDIGLSKLLPIQFIGLGVRKFITIASIVASQKDGVLLIDEFENGLHYETMDILWKAVVELCREHNIQLFATTHSYECIESFVNASEESCVYRIERKDNEHRAIRYNSDEASESIKKRWEMR